MKRLILLLIMLLLLVSCTKESSKFYPIVDKYEIKDKCYLIVEIEVDPEEFIGYELGDDYEVSYD